MPASPKDSPDLWAEAGNPATQPKRLCEMADDAPLLSRRIVEALTANPAMPPDQLAELIRFAPDAFCRNPIASLIPLEDPGFIYRVERDTLAGLLRSPHAPAVLVSQLATLSEMPEEPQEEEVTAFSDEKDLLEAARLHVSQMPTPAVKNDWQAPIRAYWRDYLQEAVVYSDQRHHLFEAVELGILPRGLVEQATQDDPACQETYEGFRQQAGHLSAALERGAATPPEEPVPAYTDLERLYTFVGAAFQGRVPTARLEEWLDRDEWVDLGIAQSEDVPPWMLAELSCSRHTSVRRMARRHPALTAEMHAVSRDHRLNEILETSQQLPLRRDNQAQWRALSAAGKLLRFAALCTAPPAIGRPRWHLFSQSVVWQERLAAAIAVSTHPRFGVLLRLLANDGNFLVRAAAQARLRSETFTWEDIPASPP